MLYLDNAAAAMPEPETLELARRLWSEDFANQESGHALGFELRHKLGAAAESLSHTFRGRGGGRVVWGNSCTELFQLLAASPLVAGREVVSSVLEHPALSAALKREARKVTLLRSGRNGQLIPEPRTGVALVALHQVQSELGAVQDLAALYAAFPGAVRFADAAQAAGKLAFPDADIVAVSGAKLGVPGGGAALLLSPDWEGAGKFADFAAAFRSRDHRISRVHPVLPQLLAFAAERRAAAAETARSAAEKFNLLVRSRLAGSRLRPTLEVAAASPFILHLSAPGMQGAVLMRMLSEAGVMVSAGSACAAESRDPSPALLALGYSRSDAYGGLRISVGWRIEAGSADILCAALEKVLQNY
jgi:cysteine desulfurase